MALRAAPIISLASFVNYQGSSNQTRRQWGAARRAIPTFGTTAGNPPDCIAMRMTTNFDVIIVGGGPAGATCAAFCARAGVRTLVLERATFPRDKVCGDCLNPDCWPVLERLGIAAEVRRLPHARLRSVEFVSAGGRRVGLPFPDVEPGEIAVKRSALDAVLLENAASAGATVRQASAVCAIRRVPATDSFEVDTAPGHVAGAPGETFTSRFVVAADGRNSVVARLLELLPEERAGRATSPPPNRVGLQAHVPCPAEFGDQVQMRWFPKGYGGLAPVGGGELNISLTGSPRTLESLKTWARAEFDLPADQAWRTIAPLDRRSARRAAVDGAFLTGDSARVVEPFTGEGIYYALRSGELAAGALTAAARGERSTTQAGADYDRAHRRMYRGRLWVNRLARAAALHPRLAAWALEAARWRPEILGYLTRKVVRA